MTKLHTTTPQAPLPTLRAAVFAVVGTVLGVSAHHLVSEGPMPWWQGLVAAAALFGLGLAGTRRPRTVVSVMTASAVGQAGLHLWLKATHPLGSAPMAMPDHAHHSMDADGAWHERVHGSLSMTAVHAVAALLVAILLHRADTVCWSLARGLTSAIDAVRARIATVLDLLRDRPERVTPGRSTLVLAWLDQPPCKEAVLADVVVRRGPPQVRRALVV
ncbi:hypothetical protein [Streptomyces sp. NBC_00645]|uniref:hypothetical protein n=1 Tax=Streptomyces sp. NBC_00645 TaxID=2975795 RepID=UPI00324DBCCC